MNSNYVHRKWNTLFIDLGIVVVRSNAMIFKNIKNIWLFGLILLLLNSCYSNQTSKTCLLYTSPSPRDKRQSRMPSSA